MQGCVDQYNQMTSCLQTEKSRISQKEKELKELVETGFIRRESHIKLEDPIKKEIFI